MIQSWRWSWILVSTLTFSVISTYLWIKKKRVFVKVGLVSKLYFFPVKSLKPVKVEEAICTKLGLEVNGLLDRSFMIVNKERRLVSQREAPTLALLTPSIENKILTITAPSGEQLEVAIKDSASEEEVVLDYRIHSDSAFGVDCGDAAATFFQSFLQLPYVRLVRFFSSFPARKYLQNNPFYAKLRKENPISFQDLSSIHMLSKASVDDLNLKITDDLITELNFRPNILVEGCAAYSEDSWKCMKINDDLILENSILVTRCLLTTNDPNTANLTKKEPLVTLRKYRIPKDPNILKITGSLPCLGTACSVLMPGRVRVGDVIMATVGHACQMCDNF